MEQSDLPAPIAWPAAPDISQPNAELEFAKMLYQAQVDEIKALRRDLAAQAIEERKLVEARFDSAVALENSLRVAIHAAYLDVAKGTLDRAIKRADFITAAAGAIGTSYAGLLGLVYSVGHEPPRPLPAVGLGSTIFFGLAFVLSSFYVGYIRHGSVKGLMLPTGTGPAMQQERLRFFIRRITVSTLRRAWALRVATACLGLGVILTPLPFLDIPSRVQWMIIIIVFLIFCAVLLYQFLYPDILTSSVSTSKRSTK